MLPALYGSYAHGGRQPNCGVEHRAPPIIGRAAITLGIGPHSSLALKSIEDVCRPGSGPSGTASRECPPMLLTSWRHWSTVVINQGGLKVAEKIPGVFQAFPEP